jgi:hypothetical protein
LKNIAAALALAMAIASPTRAELSSDPLPPALAKAAADYDRAQVKSDGAALRRLLAEDYALVHGGGSLSSKPEFIAESTTPGSTLEPYVVEHALNRVWSDGAVLSGEVTLRGIDGGKPFVGRMRFADIWRKRGGRWQVVFTQVTRLPTPSG